MSTTRYTIGIDLGTTHCVLAYAPFEPEESASTVNVLSVPQLVGPGEVKPMPLLPSFLLLPGPHDGPDGSFTLPWDPEMTIAVGEFARQRGAELPSRLVSSAKSWLCHAGIARTDPILPWDSPPDVRRISPVEACSLLLKHLRSAWDHLMGSTDPEARFEDQDITLTVPASFDAVARELTVMAAQSAGIANLTLIEEPQAAFYSWIESQRESWRKAVRVGESILVCDIGGGTTDFSLIQVAEEDGQLTLRRVAVGDHILLGGDNMDLTLAYSVQAKLAQKGTKLDSWQFRGLWLSCRAAKERLLSDTTLDAAPVVILGRGSSLIGGTIRTELLRSEVESVLLDGFFPMTRRDEFPKENPRVGMREMGLPYEADPAISRHMAGFLGRQAPVASSGLGDSPVPFPAAVLFNGGVMKSPLIRRRVLDILKSWVGKEELRELTSPDLDLAVARGAAYYGLARLGRGIRIRGGSARPYYIGIESALPAVPGIPAPMKALCVVPFGMEEGTELEIRQREFGLVVGEQAVFHLLTSTTRKKDQAGEIVEDWQGEINKVTTMEALLPASAGEEGGGLMPVWLRSRLTELGTLELWCVARDEDRNWKLEFNLREQERDA